MAGNVKFIVAPESILKTPGLSATAKLVYALLRFRQGKNKCCWPGLESIAADLGVSRSAAIRAVAGLEVAGLITVEGGRRRSSIYRIREKHDDNYLIIESATLSASITPAAKLIFSYIKYRTGDNSEAWPHQKTIAADLGLSRATVSRILADLEKTHAIQVRHAHGGRKQGNRYRTTCKFFKVPLCGARPESGASKRYPKSNTSKELKGKDKVFSQKQGLSFEMSAADRAYWSLIRERVADKVAASIVFEQRHPPESIQAAIDNAKTREPLARARGRQFNRPAYIVGSLNAARHEAHNIRLSPLAREQRLQVQILSDNIKRSRCRIIPESEKRQKLESMKAAMYAAAM